jgi:hypothetical protein
MNNKLRVVGAFFVGAIVSAAIAHFYYKRHSDGLLTAQFHYSEFILRAEMVHHSVKVLTCLQTGDVTNAVERSEREIDLGVSGLGWLAKETQTNKFLWATEKSFLSNEILRVIGDAKKYREVFPRRSADLVRGIEFSNAFALVNVHTNR